MELAFLDKDFRLIKYFDFINLQWNRAYYEPGNFMVQIPACEYVNGAEYIFNNKRPELGMIQKFEYTKDSKNQSILLSGYFYEFKLNDKITYPRFTKRGNIEMIAREIVTTFKADIPLLVLGDTNNPLKGSSISKQTTGEGLATALYALLKTQSMSYRCRYNFEDNKMFFEVWQGLDRTQSQSINPFASFSEKLKNVHNEKVTRDVSGFKNYAYVVGNGSYENGKQIVVEVDGRSIADEYKRIVYIDQTSLIYDPEKDDLKEYKNKLVQKGKEILLAKYANVLNVSFDAEQSSGLRYLDDYDLGDKCDLLIDDLQLAFTVRLTGIKELFKNSTHKITLQFGERIPVAYRR